MVMAVRLILTDDMWARLQAVRDAIRPAAGLPLILGDRMFVEAMLYLSHHGTIAQDGARV